MNSRRVMTLAIVAVLTALGAGCTEKSIQARGFVLPEGDPGYGEQAVVALQCQQCHTVRGVVLDADTTMRDGPVVIELGGPVTNIKTYGDLVTSIIHPSEKIVGPRDEVMKPDGTSRMTDYNHIMTVQQMVDLVAFLQPKYEFVPSVYPLP